MRPLIEQILRFGAVGVAGFIVDSSVLLAALAFTPLGPYGGRVVSFLCAATVTWALNRRFTFAGARNAAAGSQWFRFLAVNAIGGAVNYGVYALCIARFGTEPPIPVLAVAFGSIAGLAFNFTLSRTLVFAHKECPPPAGT